MRPLTTLLFLFCAWGYPAQIFTHAGGNLNNGVTTSFSITVSNLPTTIDSTFGLESVCINISHPAVEELHIYLKSPAGIEEAFQ